MTDRHLPAALLIHQTPGRSTVTAGVWVLHGASHDADQLAGATHLVEHLTLRRCGGRDRLELARLVDRLGGDVDAWTGSEVMGLTVQTTVDALPEALALLSDAVLAPTFAAADVDLERRVALVELDLVEDDPEEMADEAILRAAWGRHPLARPVIGRRATVGALTPEVLRRHHAAMVQPGSVLAAVVGDVDETEVARCLAPLPLAAPPRPSVLPPLEWQGERTEVVRPAADQVHARVAFPTPGSADPRVAALAVLNRVLGVGASSRLFQRLREEAGLTYDISSGLVLRSAGGLLEVAWTSAPESFPTTWQLIRGELAGLAAGVCDDEVAVAREALVRGLEMDIEDCAARCAMELAEVVERGRLFDPARAADEVVAVSAAEVAALARGLLRPETMATAVCGPKGVLERVA